MNDAMQVLVVINAIAILNGAGRTKALAYLMANGWEYQEALDVITFYENARVMVYSGMLP